MKIQKITNLLLLLLLPVFVFSQASYRMSLTKVIIKGTSNVHKWESTVGQLSGSATLTLDGDQIKSLTQARFDIPVKSIKSSKGKIMDNKTYDALKADECANISFLLSSPSVDGSGNLTSKGSLTIACSTKAIDLTSTVKSLGNGEFSISGSKKMKMTDFGIKPPTALLGTMTTGDEITIEYEVKLVK